MSLLGEQDRGASPHCCVLAPSYGRSRTAALVSPCLHARWLSPSPAYGSTEMLIRMSCTPQGIGGGGGILMKPG